MAVDTERKRSAALRFGNRGLAATRRPTLIPKAFDRGALLACYYSAPQFGEPKQGWIFETPETAWKFSTEDRVWMFTAEPSVFVFGE